MITANLPTRILRLSLYHLPIERSFLELVNPYSGRSAHWLVRNRHKALIGGAWLANSIYKRPSSEY